MTLIDGKAISEQVKQEIAAEVAEIVAQGGKRPHLPDVLVCLDGGPLRKRRDRRRTARQST